MLTAKELYRKILHLLLGISIALAYQYDLLSPFTLLMMIIAGVIISILSKRIWLPFLSFFLEKLEREEEKKQFPGKGLIFFFVGVLLAVKLFPKDIALASIMILAFGDSISHLIGARFGKIKNILNGDGKKLIEGTIAGIIAGLLGAMFYVPFSQALLGSTAAMLAEVVKIDFNENQLDDNVVIPLVAGTIMLLSQRFM